MEACATAHHWADQVDREADRRSIGRAGRCEKATAARSGIALDRGEPVNLEHVLGNIQANRSNLHVDGSLHVIRRDDHLMALQCRERAP